MRTFDINTPILEESWEGYKDWNEAAEYFYETDTGSVCTPTLAFDPYSATGQRQHLALTIANATGSAKSVAINWQGGNGLGVWVYNTVITTVTVTMEFRYKADVGLAGISELRWIVANNPFPGNLVVTSPTCDGEWHRATGSWSMQVDANLFTGARLEVNGIPNAASGVLRVDDFRLTRVGNVLRVIDSACPVFSPRMDWGNGFKESYGFLTDVHNADDGSEWREQLRMIPSCQLSYSIVTGDPQTSAFVDQFLYRYHGQIVAVPRWQDAVPFSGTQSSGHEVFTSSTFTSRWFQPRQRFMVWRSATEYEAEIIDTINTTRITIDPAEGAVTGSWTTSDWIVPLVPGRLVDSVPVRRPNGSLSSIDLTFDIQMVQ